MFENLDAAGGLPIVLIMWGWGALQVIAGFKLLQDPPGDESQPEYDEVPEELWLEAAQTEAPAQPISIHRKSRRAYTRKTIKRHR